MQREELILEGEFLYDGEVPARVRITRQPITPGTADYEDPPEIAEDRLDPSYRIDWSAPGQPDRIVARVGAFPTAEEARAFAEAQAPGLAWKTAR